MTASGAVGQQVVVKTVLMLVDDKRRENKEGVLGDIGKHVRAVWRCELGL